MRHESFAKSVDDDLETAMAADCNAIDCDDIMMFTSVAMSNIVGKASEQQVELWKKSLCNLKNDFKKTFKFNVKDLNTEIKKIVLLLANANHEPEDLVDNVLKFMQDFPLLRLH